MASFGFFLGTFEAVAGAINGISDIARGSVYRPSGWNDDPAPTMLIVPGSPASFLPPIVSTVPGIPDAPGFQESQATPDEIYIFDAILRAEHAQEVHRTQHPVQTGANISDHAYKLPARIVLEIGMSDAMDSFIPGTWTSRESKSVSAYETLLRIQADRKPVSLNTRLRSYDNMLIESVSSADTDKTRYSLKATVVFTEIFIATAESTSSSISFGGSIDSDSSARPQTTGSTGVGTVQASAPSQALTEQHSLLSQVNGKISQINDKLPAINLNARIIASVASRVPGAGYWSSNILSALPQRLPQLSNPFQG